MDLRISVPMTFMRSLGLRQFFYRKRKLIFFGPFLFKFAVHYLRNGPEDFGSDDIYEVPRPQTIFVYIYKKIFLGPFFFQIRGHYLRIEPGDFGSDDISEVPWHHSRSKPMRHLKEHAESEKILLSGHIHFLVSGPKLWESRQIQVEVNVANTTAIMDMIRAPLSKQTCCTSTRDCSINIESTNFKLSRQKAKNIIQVQDKLYYEIPHSS